MAKKQQPAKSTGEPFSLFVNEHHPANVKVLAYLLSQASRQGKRLGQIAPPASVKDPHMNCGSHPDIVEYVWGPLGSALAQDGRALIFGTPTLIHANSGVILAVCFGTC
jgi:hypothetical protein